MANNESQFCVEIRHDIENQIPPAHVLKHSDNFIVGILDLQLQTVPFGHWLIEAKFLRRSPNSDLAFPLEMTDKQRKFMKEEQWAGGQAGWALCVRFSDRESRCYLGVNAEIERVARNDTHVVRLHGQRWNTVAIFSILEHLHGAASTDGTFLRYTKPQESNDSSKVARFEALRAKGGARKSDGGEQGA